jgi:hypothetical protein
MWYFDDYGFNVSNGNVTVTDFFRTDPDDLALTAYAPTGNTSITNIFCMGKGEPKQIHANGWWQYNGTTGILQVNMTHASSKSLWISWSYPTATYTGAYYMRAETFEANNATGYLLHTDQGQNNTNVQLIASGNSTVYYGYRVYQLPFNGTATELTAGYPEAVTWRDSDGSGLQNASWTCPGSDYWNIGVDALKIDLYVQVGSGGWLKEATFITNPLEYTKLKNATWVFSTYTHKDYNGTYTNATVFWGSSTYNTLVDGVSFTLGDIYDQLVHRLNIGDFVGFITLPFTNLVGDSFYGLLFFGLSVTLYRRFHSFTPILVIFLIGGGIGGFVDFMIPQVASGIAWLFFFLGLAGLLWKVFR